MSMKHNTLVATTTALFLAGGSVQALDLEIGAHFADYDDLDNGFGLHGHLDVMPQVRLSGSYTAVEYADILVGRAGYVLDLEGMGLEVELGAGYQFWDFEGELEDDVYGIHGIASYYVMDELAIRGKLEFLTFDNLDDDTLVFGVGAGYDITPEFNVALDVEIYESDFIDQTFIRLGASYRF